MPIPNDPIILMSYLNTQLRDHYSSLEDLCKSMDLDASEIAEKLSITESEVQKILDESE